MTEYADGLPFSEWDAKTKRYRVAVRGEDRRVSDRWAEKKSREYNSKASWTRRFLCTRPGATFDANGKLIISTEDLELAMKNLQDRFDKWAGK